MKPNRHGHLPSNVAMANDIKKHLFRLPRDGNDGDRRQKLHPPTDKTKETKAIAPLQGNSPAPNEATTATKMRSAEDNMKKYACTLKMEVNHTEHSNLIGPRGTRIKYIRKYTGCYIHFPDANLLPHSPKINQVTIAGHYAHNLEIARLHLRKATPVPFHVNLYYKRCNAMEVRQKFLKLISKLQTSEYRDRIAVNYKFYEEYKKIYVTVKGSEKYATIIRKVMTKIAQLSRTAKGQKVMIESSIDVLCKQEDGTQVLADSNLKTIMSSTGTRLKFGRVNDTCLVTRSRVYIMGGVESIYYAHRQLYNYMPVELCFDLPNLPSLNELNAKTSGIKINVTTINIEEREGGTPANKKGPYKIRLTSTEKNIRGMYKLLGDMTEGNYESPVLKGVCSGFAFFPNMGDRHRYEYGGPAGLPPIIYRSRANSPLKHLASLAKHMPSHVPGGNWGAPMLNYAPSSVPLTDYRKMNMNLNMQALRKDFHNMGFPRPPVSGIFGPYLPTMPNHFIHDPGRKAPGYERSMALKRATSLPFVHAGVNNVFDFKGNSVPALPLRDTKPTISLSPPLFGAERRSDVQLNHRPFMLFPEDEGYINLINEVVTEQHPSGMKRKQFTCKPVVYEEPGKSQSKGYATFYN